MKRWNFTLALASLTLCGLMAAEAGRAQTPEPPQPLTPPSEAPAAAAPVAPASAAPAPETTATAVAGDEKAPVAAAPRNARGKAKRKTAAKSVTVINARAAMLVSLEAGPAGSDKWKKIAGPLAPGKTVAVRAPRAKDCLVDLKGTFADGQTMDAARVDVCSQKVLNLTE